jgi:hypothetical protein
MQQVVEKLTGGEPLGIAPMFKGTSFKTELDKRYRECSLNNHLRSVPLFANSPRQAAFTPVRTMRPNGWIRGRFFGDAIEAQTMLFKTAGSQTKRLKAHLTH